MKDVITYCANLDALRAELNDKGLIDEEGKPSLQLVKTPVIKNHKKRRSLALVRLVEQPDQDTLYRLKNLEVLGSYDEVFADPAKLKKYDSVYNRAPREEIDPETGETTIITPPDKFGVFA